MTTKRRQTGLLDLFGHTFVEENGQKCIHRQFQIRRRLRGEQYLVQWFSFLDEGPTNLGVIPEVDLLDEAKVKLYETAELWRWAYEKHEGNRRRWPTLKAIDTTA